MDENTELIDEYQKAHRHMMELVSRFPKDQREAVLFDKWSLKDMLAHLAAWNHVDAEHAERVRDGKAFDWISDWDAFNEQEVAKRKHLLWDAVVAELDSSANYLAATFRALPESIGDKLCGPENKSSPRRWLIAEIEHYRDTHTPEVAHKLRELEGL